MQWLLQLLLVVIAPGDGATGVWVAEEERPPAP